MRVVIIWIMVIENPVIQHCHRTRSTLLTMTERQSEPIQSFTFLHPSQLHYVSQQQRSRRKNTQLFPDFYYKPGYLSAINIILCGVTVAVHHHDITDKEVWSAYSRRGLCETVVHVHWHRANCPRAQEWQGNNMKHNKRGSLQGGLVRRGKSTSNWNVDFLFTYLPTRSVC